MKILILSSFLILVLSGCSWIGRDKSTSTSSPYPSTSMDASGVTLPPAEEGDNFEAKGNEPFWSAIISASGTTFSRPGEESVESRTYETRQSKEDGIITIKDGKGEFFVTIVKERCSDGMSDTSYDYKATVLMGSETLTGCALKR